MVMMSNPSRETIPCSATRPYIAYTGVGAIVGAVFLLRYYAVNFNSLWVPASIVISIFALTVICLEIITNRRNLTGEHARIAPANSSPVARTTVKLLGLTASLGFIGLLYWIFPEYHGVFYADYFRAMRYFLPALLVVAPAYFYYVDKRMPDPFDGYWHLGSIIIFKSTSVDITKVWQHLLGWIVKGFFLPLMFTYLCKNMNDLLKDDFFQFYSFEDFCNLGVDFLYFLDVAVAVAGYIFSLRLFDTHIRSCEPTLTGWCVALICYQPFYSVFGDQYVAYSEGTSWTHWLEPYPALRSFWGAVILLLVFIYAWATVVFGLRFSNLTNRGIITAGPYRWTKHPAYLAKNISWWMISMPFLSEAGGMEAVRHCLLLGCLNFIYFLRAATEERHLESDATYVQYSNWINNYGLVRKVKFYFVGL